MTDLTLNQENGEVFALFKGAKKGDAGSFHIDYTVESISESEIGLKLSRIESVQGEPEDAHAEDEYPGPGEPCPECGKPLDDEGKCPACGWEPGETPEEAPAKAEKKPFAVLIGR